MKKRIFPITLVLLMALALSVPALAAGGYSDVPSSHWANSNIESCTIKGLMQGVGGGRFDPEGTLTRAQVAQICYNAYKGAMPSLITNKSLDDVAVTAWYRDAMYWIVANGIMDSADSDAGQYCQPDAPADRKYVALALYRIAGKLKATLPEVNPAVIFPGIGALENEYQTAIRSLQQAGVISGFPDGRYGPDDSLTRAQAAKLFDVYTDIEGLRLAATREPPVDTPPVSSETFLSKAIYDEIKPYAESLGYSCDSHSTSQSSSYDWTMTFTKGLTLVSMSLVHDGDHWNGHAYQSYGTSFPEKNIQFYNLDDMKAVLARYANPASSGASAEDESSASNFLTNEICKEVKEYALSVGFEKFVDYTDSFGGWQIVIDNASRGRCITLGFRLAAGSDHWYYGVITDDSYQVVVENGKVYNMDEMKAVIKKCSNYE